MVVYICGEVKRIVRVYGPVYLWWSELDCESLWSCVFVVE